MGNLTLVYCPKDKWGPEKQVIILLHQLDYNSDITDYKK